MNFINNLKHFSKSKLFQNFVLFENENVIFRRHSNFSEGRTNSKYGFPLPLPLSKIYHQRCFATSSQLSNVPLFPRNILSPQTRGNARSFFESAGADINTNVSKDIVIFEYKNERMFMIIKYFGLTQIFIWGYLANTSYTTLVDSPVQELPHRELQWWEKVNLGENWIRNGITTLCVLMGVGLFSLAYSLSVRTVKQIVLHRGGRDITIQTYAFFGGDKFRVPLQRVSCSMSRTGAKHHLPLKVKGKWLYFTLDSKGTFPHPTLFEWTAGLKRNI